MKGQPMFKSILSKVELPGLSFNFSNPIGIDLGTSTTIAAKEGERDSIFFTQPTLVAINRKTDQVVAIGKRAREMLDRTPPHIEVIRPIREGVVHHYDVALELFKYIFRKAQRLTPKLFGPRVVVGIPCCAQPTKIDSITDAAKDAGASAVYVVDEPLAATVGIGLPLSSESAKMVVDVGGGTSDILVFASNEVIASHSIQIGGEAFDSAIVESLKKWKNLSIGLRTAEDLKKTVMNSHNSGATYTIHGTNTMTQLPLETVVTEDEILDYITPSLDEIVQNMRVFMEGLSPEVQADLKRDTVYFVGGGQMIYTFSGQIERGLNIKITVPKDPITSVARGALVIAKDPEKYSKYFLN